MLKNFTLKYWLDDGWYVGRLHEIPNVFSQGETLEELKINIRDSYQMMMEDAVELPVQTYHSTEVQLEVA